MMRPFDDLGDVGVDRQQREVLTGEAQDEDGHDGSDETASASGQAHATEHHGGHAGHQVGALDGGSDAGVHGQDQPAHGREEAAQRIGGDTRPSTGTPLRKAARRSEPTA